jgi:hypothetical protein
MLNVKFINNNGGGFARTIPVDEGTTLGDFLKEEMEDSLSNYKIRHNENRVCDWDTELSDGDRILVTPIKMGGAAAKPPKKATKAKKKTKKA